MERIEGLCTIRPFNPGSLLIRVANPVSIVKIAPASHIITIDGDTGYGIEASATHGVRRALLKDMLKGLTVVKRISHEVPDAEAGLQWGRLSAARKDKYDIKGALGLGLGPDRNWQDPADWFCFEHYAMIVLQAGRKTFVDNAHVTAYMLMSLHPDFGQS